MFAGYFIALARHWARVCKFVCAAVAVGIADPGWCKHCAWAGGGILQATGRGVGADISQCTPGGHDVDGASASAVNGIKVQIIFIQCRMISVLFGF